MKLWETLLNYIDEAQHNDRLVYDELEDLFIPPVFVAEKNGNRYYKLNDMPEIEVTQTELDVLLAKVKYIYPERYHRVYNEKYYQTGQRISICTFETKKYGHYVLYLNYHYVVPIFIRLIDVNERKLQLHPRCITGMGKQASQQINQDLRDKAVIGAKQTLTTALTTDAMRRFNPMLKMCVPGQIGWYQRNEQILQHCYKADVSSAFPFQLTKPIPTLRGALVFCDQWVIPTEQYPFVFAYTLGDKYGTVSIYNELDTDEDLQSPYMSFVREQYESSSTRNQYLKGEYTEFKRTTKINLNPFYKGKQAKKFICIACPAASFTLKDIMEMHYDRKLTASTVEEKDYEKMVMNALIGYFQKNDGGTLPFISAVVIARQNHRMIEICNEIVNVYGGIPVYIATDSIIWQYPADVSVKDKWLGSFTTEYEDCEAYIGRVGAYQIRTKEGKTITICSYLPNDSNKLNMKFAELPRPKKESK